MSATRPLFGDIDDLEDWQEDAACKGVDIDIFFSLDDEEQKRALELCRGCPSSRSASVTPSSTARCTASGVA